MNEYHLNYRTGPSLCAWLATASIGDRAVLLGRGPPQKKHSHTEYDGSTQDKLSIKRNQALFSSFYNFSVILGPIFTDSSAILGQFFTNFFVLPSFKMPHGTRFMLGRLLSTMLPTCGAPGSQVPTFSYQTNTKSRSVTRGLYLCQESKSCLKARQGAIQRI